MGRDLAPTALLCLLVTALVVVAAPARAGGLPCLGDPAPDARARWTAIFEQEADNWFRPTHPLDEGLWPDLDGDGVAERAWYVSGRCGASGNCDYLLYASGRGCPRYVGHVYGVDLTPLQTSSNGLADLWTFSRAGCAGAAGTAAIYRFDGTEYVASKVVHCPCPSSEPDAPRAQECRWRDEGVPGGRRRSSEAALPPAPGPCAGDAVTVARHRVATTDPGQARERAEQFPVPDLDGDGHPDAVVLVGRTQPRGEPVLALSGSRCPQAVTADQPEVALLPREGGRFPPLVYLAPAPAVLQAVVLAEWEGRNFYAVVRIVDCEQDCARDPACGALELCSAEDAAPPP